MMKLSISIRLALMFALAAMTIVSGYALLLHHSLHESLRNQMHKELQFRHSLIAPYLTSLTTPKDWQMIQAKFDNLIQVEGGKAQYWILSEDVRYRIGSPLPGGVNWAQLKSGFTKMPDNENARSFYLLITDIPARGERPALRSAVAIDSTPYLGTLNEFTRVLIIITVLGVLLVAVLGFVIARIGMRPVNNLSRQAHTLVPGDHSRRLDTVDLPIELQKLATSFNGVLARQEVAWKQLESFNADVAHELRTPLTNLIGQTQLGLSRERNIHEWEDLLQSNLEELERMTSIVNDMLFLSHAQAGQFATQLTKVSLREETLKTAEYVEPSFAEKTLTLRIEGDILAQVDRRLFHRSLANLLENSARHAPANSEVTVTLEKVGELAHIAVTNVGDPITDTHLARLFERFYRVDASRTRSDMHHGLGLSIVRAVALMHHGDVFAKSGGGINTFGFSLAIAPHEKNQ
ncbi:heavy metal sensor histidine kinase [Pectobacterium versatile]|uniref:heavy metal sensor histidine kinase n=1 Tax=Pectobacterium versatile TaxID=2488639 RepID=UPI001CE12060|nr:heavy metal sensor histidine kinase [Pectobacterium versatile]MCA5931974.1 heavy metal sensor histidine kinase [Pectobacterium versatile]MCA5949697.1 heavy metal sensor histidine kinase [Pectobacterium versatile]MCA5953441.1 heavy metal sensor histidine kinase [Pectobacterium versatile]UCP85411.1 heavy metal sensor histidine kinase [Pectobacterium versatile]